MSRVKSGPNRARHACRSVGPDFALAVSRSSLPGAVVDGILVGRSAHRHVPLDRPVIGVLETLARIRRHRGIEQAPGLQFVRLQEAAGLCDQIVDVRCGVLFEDLDRPVLRPEDGRERRTVEFVTGRLAAGRMRFR